MEKVENLNKEKSLTIEENNDNNAKNKNDKPIKERINLDNIKTNNEDLMELRKQPLKNRTFFYKNELLVEGEDEFTEFKNYFYPLDEEQEQEIKRQYCGFLNNKGGRIYIGIKDDKTATGIQLTYKDQDTFRNSLVGYGNDFYPKCRLDKIKIFFIPLKNSITKKFINNLFVVKIIILPGDPYVLYSMTTKEFKSTKRLQGQSVNLTAEEINKEIIERAISKIKGNYIIPNESLEFNDPEPEKNYDITIDKNKKIVKKVINKSLIGKNIQYIVVIKNIDMNLKVKDINKQFNGYKCSAQKFPKKEGKSTGMGKLYFASEDTAKEVMNKFNGSDLGGKRKIIMVLKRFTYFKKLKNNNNQ